MVFCNSKLNDLKWEYKKVTILILIDGFLQYFINAGKLDGKHCHNPYFNRWFSAIYGTVISSLLNFFSHNPYFNRWFSAIIYTS